MVGEGVGLMFFADTTGILNSTRSTSTPPRRGVTSPSTSQLPPSVGSSANMDDLEVLLQLPSSSNSVLPPLSQLVDSKPPMPSPSNLFLVPSPSPAASNGNLPGIAAVPASVPESEPWVDLMTSTVEEQENHHEGQK